MKTPRRSVWPERNAAVVGADHLHLDLAASGSFRAGVADRHADAAGVGLLQDVQLQGADQHDPRGVAVAAAGHHEVGALLGQGEVDGRVLSS